MSSSHFDLDIIEAGGPKYLLYKIKWAIIRTWRKICYAFECSKDAAFWMLMFATMAIEYGYIKFKRAIKNVRPTI